MIDLARLRLRFGPFEAWIPHAARCAQWGLLFALLASLRLVLLHLYGTDLPYSDQWDSEGWNWLRPYHAGNLDWSVLFLPHNEHRIVLVRLQSLVLFAMNDHQWDNLVLTTVNALFVAALGSYLVRTLFLNLEPYLWPVPMFVLTALCLPCGYENLLVGFQVQIYFLIALAIGGIWLAASRPQSIGLALALGAISGVSLVTLASGIFTAPAIAFAAALRLWTTRTPWRAAAPMAAVLVAAIVAGTLLLVHVANHDSLHAHDFGDWLHTMVLVGSWPLPAWWACPLLLWAPCMIAFVVTLRTRNADSAHITAFAIAVWTALQAASIAYGRAHDLLSVHSRYTDILAPAVIVNAFFCLRLSQTAAGSLVPRGRRLVLASLWLCATAAGYAAQGAIGLVEMQQFGLSRLTQTDNVRRYVQEMVPTAIDSALPWNLPYPNKPRLKAMLDDKTLRDILPASTRQPLSLGGYANGFTVNGTPPHVSRPRGKGAYGSYGFGTGGDNTAVMVVADLHSRFPYLQFLVAGFPGAEDVSLSVAAADGSDARSVVPATPPNETYTSVTVPIPSEDFQVVAHDASHTLWLAFQSPVEIGRLSYWTHWLLDISPFLLFASLCAVFFLAQLAWLRRFSGADAAADRTGQS